MRLLLDTCALLALATGTLPERSHAALLTASTAILSPVVPWELAIMVKAGKLRLPEPPLAYVEALAARHSLTLSKTGLGAALLCAAADLPLVHRDPFDRILIATAQAQQLTLITSDQIISTYPQLSTLW